MRVTEKDLIGEIAGFPIEMVERMLKHQQRQNGKTDVTVFQRDKSAGGALGFTWQKTPEGINFWSNVINGRYFDKFFETYPKRTHTPSLFNGDITGFPAEVVNKMLEYQYKQTGKMDISVFECKRSADRDQGGFDWTKTEESKHHGMMFWSYVIHDMDFDRFFKLYPKDKKAAPIGGMVINPRIGDKVVRGSDWKWGDQDKGSEYGIITELNQHGWVRVLWYDREDKPLDQFNYRCGNKHMFDLNYYGHKSSKSFSSPIKSEHGIKVQRPVAAIRAGERITGSSVQGRRSCTAVRFGHLSYQTVKSF